MILPTNTGFEQTVLAGMLNDEECFYEGLSFVDAEHFTTSENIAVFQRLSKKEEMPSANILMKEVENSKEKSAIRVIDSTWTNRYDFQQALNGLKEVFKKRCLYYSIEKLKSRFENEKTDKLIDDFTREVSDNALNTSGQEIIDPAEHASDYLSNFYEIYGNPDLSKGIPYSVTDERGRTKGLPALDETFNGAQGGDLIMVAAKTGEGKSAFAINLSRIFSMHQSYIGYYENTEMRVEELLSRLLAPIAVVKSNEIETGRLEGTESERNEKVSRISSAYEAYRQSKFILSRVPHLPLFKAKGLAKQVRLRHGGLDYLIIDYIGRMQMNSNQNSWDELYEITKALKELAIELDIPIFMLAQRNQAGEVEGAKKMMNECDGVLFFEPTSEDDNEFIRQYVRSDQQQKVNYRIVKKKVRRNDNAAPIYCMFDKSKSLIVEAKRA
ncbi:DnaB-like helicase C-terminal domain-containing protein [Virgibacillus salexigens]|uniref:DNA 5'-3' helicase n=1 Tax=Virgibacillus kapii TaxID=1638645 RepID=A0ABQ2D8N7_9BACI|nr:DnaB-like helicase C-terminal domain-containing protein [Virgibacillus kapii]GGJ48857.1 replicative DNA helicase [Virgibacillus kapii]